MCLWGLLFVHVLKRMFNYTSADWHLPRDLLNRPQSSNELLYPDKTFINPLQVLDSSKRNQRMIALSFGLLIIWSLSFCSIVGWAFLKDYVYTTSMSQILNEVIIASVGLVSIVICRLAFTPILSLLNTSQHHTPKPDEQSDLLFKVSVFESINIYGHMLFL